MECEFCLNHEQGDTLYEPSDWDGGIGFDYIRDIKYCPLCGRKLHSEDEPSNSEKLNNCETCRFELYCPEMCEGCCEWDSHYEPKDEPQTKRPWEMYIIEHPMYE